MQGCRTPGDVSAASNTCNHMGKHLHASIQCKEIGLNWSTDLINSDTNSLQYSQMLIIFRWNSILGRWELTE
jgi:hypothetical protein